MEQGANAADLKRRGLNAIVNPVGDSKVAGVYNVDSLEDEADMWAGPGNGAWTGNFPGQGQICVDPRGECGFTIMESHQSKVTPGTMRYANYGKGVAFWGSDAAARQFMTRYQDVTSIDLYWGTDYDLCQASQGGDLLKTGRALSSTECHKPANYGQTVKRARQLVDNKVPIWNYVELGHPGVQGTSMPVAKIRPAVWSSLIHGARGIVYFNHSFGGSCISQHVMQDCDPAIGSAVQQINAEIASLAPALNSPTVNGVKVEGAIDQLTKFDGRNLWIFAGSNRGEGSTSGRIQLPQGVNGTAEVIGENRQVSVNGGVLSDTWSDPNAVHLYKVTLS